MGYGRSRHTAILWWDALTPLQRIRYKIPKIGPVSFAKPNYTQIKEIYNSRR